ncbi:MAG: hypothetical protein K1X67_24260 [Fimbriimonadaceae bacterium]|nr:hypothetical protein [Fimbriimonadaceae bacterium]
MKLVSLLAAVLAVGIFAGVRAAEPEVRIPRSMAGDKGKYYLLEKKSVGAVLQVVHKRVGVESIDYSRTEINCKTRQYRELGYSSESVAALKAVPGSKWTDLVSGSSKSDLVAFACK